MKINSRRVVAALLLSCAFGAAQAQSCVPISAVDSAYSQDFNTLVSTGTATNNALSIPGWYLLETGGGARANGQYAVDTGASNTGDTFSYGAAGSTERALGSLRSGTLIASYGACFTNNTGATITALDVGYTGEQWRLGTAGRADTLEFAYSSDATSLDTGTWTPEPALAFTTPNQTTTGAKDGNAAANRTVFAPGRITGLSVANGATFWVRWSDLDANGADDGLAIDDVTLVANPSGGGTPPVLSIGNVSATEGNSGTKPFLFTVSLSRAADAGGVTFSYATADGTAIGAQPIKKLGARTKGVVEYDYLAKTGTATIAEGDTSVTIQVDVIGDTTVEPDETFFVDVTNVTGATVGTARGTGTIVNDDVVITPIDVIQGTAQRSLLDGQQVVTTGIVTARRNNGFFLQMADGETSTAGASRGIYVFTSSAPTAAATVGNRVQVAGTVTEYVPAADPYQLPLTELTFATVNEISQGNALPTPVVLTTALLTANGGLEQLEPYESMRVTAPSFTVVAPTRGNISEANATATSNGLIAIVVTGTERPLREAGLPAGTPPPAGTTAANIPVWDFNPEVLVMDVDGLGAPLVDLAAGCRIINNSGTGPLDYGFRRFTIYPEQAVQTDCSEAQARGSNLPSDDDATFATYNMQRFYDTANDPATSDVVLTAAAYAGRLNKASIGIRDFLHLPDVIGISEMENLPTLQAVADKVNADVVAGGGEDPHYVPYLLNGFDVGGINVGFLVKTASVVTGTPRVEVTSVAQIGTTERLVNPDSTSSVLNDRPPLVLTATVRFADGRTLPVTVLAVHQRSLSGIDDETAGSNGWLTAGARVRAKRQAQSEYLATQIQAMQSADPARRIIVLGDFNAFDFNDGYVDALGTVIGAPSPDDTTAVNGDGTSPVSPALTNMTLSVPVGERYSFVFDSNAQSLDHILVNQALLQAPDVASLTLSHARINADFPETARNDFNSAVRLADHDPSVLLVRMEALTFADLVVIADAETPNVAVGGTATWTVNLKNNGPEAAEFPAVGFAIDRPLAGATLTGPNGWTCAISGSTPTTTEGACVAATLVDQDVATFTVTAPAPAAAAGGELRLVAAANSQTADDVTTNNSDSAVVLVDSQADVSVVIDGPRFPAPTYAFLPYTITVSNAGPSTATGVEVAIASSQRSRGTTVQAPAGWTCAASGVNTVTVLCRPENGTLASQASATITLGIANRGRMVFPIYTIRADVDTTTPDPELDNNSATLSANSVFRD